MPIIRRTAFSHFYGGTTVTECMTTVETLAKSNIRSILDFAAEDLSTEQQFDSARNETLRTIEQSARISNMPFVVFKVSGLGRTPLLEAASSFRQLTTVEEVELEKVRARVNALCEAAHNADRRVLIDAEYSWTQPIIDNWAIDLMREFNREKAVIYNTVQMYRVDRMDYLRDLHLIGLAEGFKPGIKLVRGAYMEKERARAASLGLPSPIQPNKDATDHHFNAALEYCLNHIDEMAIMAGTHNEESCYLLVELMHNRNVESDDPRIEFAQLFGMGDNLSYILAGEGYNVSKYVPYGPPDDALPYLIRRASENSSVMGMASRQLQLIRKEIRRRAHAP